MKLYLPAFIFLFSVHLFSEYKFETVLDNLGDAWSFVFLNEDEVLFTEMPGKLKIASLKDKSITILKIFQKLHIQVRAVSLKLF